MKYILYLISIIVVIALTVGGFGELGIGAFVPNILLLIILSVALEYSIADFMFFALIGGIWLDVIYGLPIGSFTLAFVICGGLSTLVFQRVFYSEVNARQFLLVVGVATLLLNLWLWSYTQALHYFHIVPTAISGLQLLRHTPAMLIANLILTYPLYALVEIISKTTARWTQRQTFIKQ
jgi:cell shape-determining protein MreD